MWYLRYKYKDKSNEFQEAFRSTISFKEVGYILGLDGGSCQMYNSRK